MLTPPLQQEASAKHEIARAAGVVGSLTLCSRITGMIRDVIIGYAFGSGAAADAFFVAFRVPNLLRRLVAEGAMSVAFVPVFTDYFTRGSRAEAVRAARALGTVMLAALVPFTVLAIAAAPRWIPLFAPGFAPDAEKLALTVRLSRLILPYVVLISMVAFLAGLLNALRHFLAPAASPLLLNLSIIAAVLLLARRLATPVHALAYGVLLGEILQLLLQAIAVRGHRIGLTPLWRPTHPIVGRVLLLMTPTLFGAAVYQVNMIMSTIFASLLPAGSVSYLWYADRVFEFPLGIVAAALGTVTLPSSAAQAARGARDEMRRSLAFAMRLNNFLALPAAVGLAVLAEPIVTVLFRRGAFGAVEVGMTAWALRAFAAGLWSVSLIRIVAPAFYALGDTRTPVVTATVAVGANLLLCLVLMGPVDSVGTSPLASAIGWIAEALAIVDLRHAGLALATSLAATLNLALLVVNLRRAGLFDARELAASFGRSLLASAAMLPVVHFLSGVVDWQASGGFGRKSAWLAATILAGGAVYFVAALALRASEARNVLALARRLVRR